MARNVFVDIQHGRFVAYENGNEAFAYGSAAAVARAICAKTPKSVLKSSSLDFPGEYGVPRREVDRFMRTLKSCIRPWKELNGRRR